MSSPHQVTVFETSAFARWVRKERVRKQVDALSRRLAADPRIGDVIPEAGGLRKVRMPRPGAGKRSGYRVVYAVLIDSRYVVLLSGYAKADQSDLTVEERRALVGAAAAAADELRAKERQTDGDTDEP